jgi:type IV secretory pathway VirB10-like protein
MVISWEAATMKARYKVKLTLSQRSQLLKLIHNGTDKAKKLSHARVLLQADVGKEGPGLQSKAIAAQLHIHPKTVLRIRERFVTQGLESALNRKPHKHYKSRRLDGEQETGLVAIFFIFKSNHKELAKKAEMTPLEENYTLQGATPRQQATPSVRPVATPPQLTEEQRQMLLALEKEKQARLQAHVMVLGKSQAASNMPSVSKQNASSDTNTQFMQQVSSQSTETIKLTLMKNLSLIVAKGSIIFGVLESEINSDLPGPLRAIVSEPIYSQDGSRVLIEPGSRLIGQYKSGMQAGQSRVFAVFTDIQKPDGQMVSIGSPGMDNLGTVGVGADAIDRHFIFNATPGFYND